MNKENIPLINEQIPLDDRVNDWLDTITDMQIMMYETNRYKDLPELPPELPNKDLSKDLSNELSLDKDWPELPKELPGLPNELSLDKELPELPIENKLEEINQKETSGYDGDVSSDNGTVWYDIDESLILTIISSLLWKSQLISIFKRIILSVSLRYIIGYLISFVTPWLSILAFIDITFIISLIPSGLIGRFLMSPSIIRIEENPSSSKRNGLPQYSRYNKPLTDPFSGQRLYGDQNKILPTERNLPNLPLDRFEIDNRGASWNNYGVVKPKDHIELIRKNESLEAQKGFSKPLTSQFKNLPPSPIANGIMSNKDSMSMAGLLEESRNILRDGKPDPMSLTNPLYNKLRQGGITDSMIMSNNNNYIRTVPRKINWNDGWTDSKMLWFNPNVIPDTGEVYPVNHKDLYNIDTSRFSNNTSVINENNTWLKKIKKYLRGIATYIYRR
jgi:hypothetical protein